MPGNKLTDRQITELYFAISNHYKDCSERAPAMDPAEIYNEISTALYWQINSGLNPQYRDLDADEKTKMYTVLDTFFHASAQYRRVQREEQQRAFFNLSARAAQPQPIHIHHHYPESDRYYSRSDNFLLNWMLLRELNRPYYPGGNLPVPAASQNVDHGHRKDDSNKNAEFWAMLLLIILATIAAVLTVIAMYYLLNNTLSGLERFWYNEGWMQASLSLMGMAASTVIATMLAPLAAAPIASLALAAGIINPAGVVVMGLACVAVMGAATGSYLFNIIEGYSVSRANGNALDAGDPNRFTLTDAEAEKLVAKDIDPIKVKCAIIALRADMGDENTSYLRRNTDVQDGLNKIRKLRRGEISAVPVKEMSFNCRIDALQQQPVPPPPYSPAANYAPGLFGSAFGSASQQPQQHTEADMALPPPPYSAVDDNQQGLFPSLAPRQYEAYDPYAPSAPPMP